MNFDIKKIALSLFIIMIISFSISIVLYRNSGITLDDFKNHNDGISINFDKSKNNYGNSHMNSDINKDSHFNLNDFANTQRDKELKGKFKEAVNLEKNFEAANVKSINVNTVSSDIEFIPQDRDDIKVHFEGAVASSNKIELPQLIAENINDKLSIEVKHKSMINTGFYSSTIRVNVYIPNSYVNDVNVKTVSGDINLGYIGNVKNVNLKSTSGDIKAESLYTEKTILENVSGSIKMEDFNGQLETELTSGDLYVNLNNLNNNIDCKSVSGSTKIQLPKNSEFYLETKSTSGDINCEFPISIEGKLSNNKINGKVGNGNNKIVISTVSGDINISEQ